MTSRRAAFESARTDPDKLAGLIERAIEEGAAGEAVEWSQHLSRIDPDRVRRYLLHARTLAAAGQFSQAEKVINKYEQLFSEDAESLTTQGEISLMRQLGAKAEKLLLRALTLDPKNRRAAQLLLRTASGDTAREVELLEHAASSGSHRATLELASRMLSDLRYDEAAARYEELLRKTRESAVLEEISYQLVRATLYDRAVSLVMPHIGENDLPSAVNLLAALINLKRDEEAGALLNRFAGAEVDQKIGFYRSLRTPGSTPKKNNAHVPLLEVLAACARMDTSRTRQRLYRKLLTAELLVAVALPLSRDDAGSESLRGLSPVVRTTSTLSQTLLVFTHVEALRAWNRAAHWLVVPAGEVFRYAKQRDDVEIVINAAGPSSTEIYEAELEALANDQLPAIAEHEIAAREAFYLFEPVAVLPPETLIERLKSDLAEYPEVTEAYFVQVVSERVGCASAVGLVFGSSVNATTRRDLLYDLIDPTLHAERERRVHFFAVDPKLLAEVRRIGIWLFEDVT